MTSLKRAEFFKDIIFKWSCLLNYYKGEYLSHRYFNSTFVISEAVIDKIYSLYYLNSIALGGYFKFVDSLGFQRCYFNFPNNNRLNFQTKFVQFSKNIVNFNGMLAIFVEHPISSKLLRLLRYKDQWIRSCFMASAVWGLELLGSRQTHFRCLGIFNNGATARNRYRLGLVKNSR